MKDRPKISCRCIGRRGAGIEPRPWRAVLRSIETGYNSFEAFSQGALTEGASLGERDARPGMLAAAKADLGRDGGCGQGGASRRSGLAAGGQSLVQIGADLLHQGVDFAVEKVVGARNDLLINDDTL